MEPIKGFHHNTLVNIVKEYMGSQWVIYNATDVSVCSYRENDYNTPDIIGNSGDG